MKKIFILTFFGAASLSGCSVGTIEPMAKDTTPAGVDLPVVTLPTATPGATPEPAATVVQVEPMPQSTSESRPRTLTLTAVAVIENSAREINAANSVEDCEDVNVGLAGIYVAASHKRQQLLDAGDVSREPWELNYFCAVLDNLSQALKMKRQAITNPEMSEAYLPAIPRILEGARQTAGLCPNSYTIDVSG